MRSLLSAALAMSLSAGVVRAQALTASPFTLEYRWVGNGVAGHTHAARRSTTNTFIAVSDSVVLTMASVDTAEVSTRADGADVFVRLTSQAAHRFADETAAHVGHDLAVLVNGEIVQVVTIESRLGRVAGVLSGVRRDSADAVAARINAARTPRPPA